ncbi:uncharacterized protein LOC129129144 isoform X2 [Agelaius phoeniceus]|uniref:uncharacterized protein LOC129129144 isoform X2 n=1 Tax=Agelaius phoeniceus TaxID=39638 RepID=UPI0040553336
MCTRPEGKNGNSQISSAGHDMKWKWVSLIMGFKESKFSTAAAFTNSRFGDLRLNSSWNSWKMDAENFLGVFSPVGLLNVLFFSFLYMKDIFICAS